MYKNAIKIAILALVTGLFFNACSSKSAAPCDTKIPSSLSKLTCDDSLVIGKTTKEEIENHFGGTMFNYDKPDNVTKMAYVYKEDVPIFVRMWGVRGYAVNLEVWFDKNNVLIRKNYNNNRKYMHPEMMQGFGNLMKSAFK